MVKKTTILGSRKITDLNISDLDKISRVYLSRSLELFDNKMKNTKTNEGKWKELVYCILAGSQFPVNKLKKIFPILFSKYSGILELNTFTAINYELRKKEVAKILKKLGYRYHTQKAITIVNAAAYFIEKYDSDITKFLSTGSDVNSLRKTIVTDIKGIGIKIASHWLRNIGLSVCTIDIHLRRLLFNLHLSEENSEGALKDNDFLILENVFKEWSEILGIRLGVLQFAVWEYTREYCAPLNCLGCPFLEICKRGKLFIIKQKEHQPSLFDNPPS